MADIWPSTEEVQAAIDASINSEMFTNAYQDVFAGDDRWQALPTPPEGKTFEWAADSTYIRKPPYFENMPATPPARSPTSPVPGCC